MPVGQILISSRTLRQRIKELAREITKDHQPEELVVLGLMNGSIFFLSDLLRWINLPTILETCRLRSYRGTTSTGRVWGLDHLQGDFEGRQVLVVDDILDSGATLSALRDALAQRKPRSVKIAVLLSKRVARKADVKADYVGFEIPNTFVIGYGLDYEGKYRYLPSIHLFEPEGEGPVRGCAS